MPVTTLLVNDPRLGEKAPTGEVIKWPATTLAGRTYRRSQASYKAANDGYFVALGINENSEDLEVVVLMSDQPSEPPETFDNEDTEE